MSGNGYIIIPKLMFAEYMKNCDNHEGDIEAFLKLLMKVNYSETEYTDYWCKKSVCKRGESLRSYRSWSDVFHWSVSRTYRFMQGLKSKGVIEIISHDDTSALHIRVVDYEKVDNVASQEELNGMVLDYIVSVVAKEYGETGRDVVISVPSTFTQHQRQALVDAAKLVNINVLAMIDQTTASAVTYAMTRAPDGFKRLLFMDIGGRYTEVNAVDIETKKEDGILKRSVVVLGKESVDVGGDDFTAVISAIIADHYERQYREDPRRDPKTMARLRQSSRKYKEVLSANREVIISEPNLYQGHDVLFTLTREEFEEECVTLVDKLVRPIESLLEKMNRPLVRLRGGFHEIE